MLDEPDWDTVLTGEVGETLARVGIHNAADLMIRRSANRAILLPYLEDIPVPANSDYYPYVDLNAGKAMFADTRAMMFTGWMLASIPVLEMLTGTSPTYADVSPKQFPHRAEAVDGTNWVFDKLTRTKVADPAAVSATIPPQVSYGVDWLVASEQSCIAASNPARWSESAFDVLSYTLPNLDPERATAMVNAVADSACELAEDEDIGAQLELYRAVARRDAEAMFTRAYGQLDAASDEMYWQAYLVNTAMLASVAAGRPRDAYEIWSQYGVEHYRGRPLPPYMRLVVSLSARFEDDAPTRVASD